MKRLTLLFGLALLLSGCATLNPYEEDFKCEKTAEGKCVTVETAYFESKGITEAASADSTEYEQALYDRMAGLLQAPSTPIVVPPKVMRVLILPYEGKDSELYMLRYAYIFVDPPRWMLTDPLEREK